MKLRTVAVLMMLTLGIGIVCGQDKRASELESLAAAERAFAAETVKSGFRDGFIKYFAEDGIGFGPHPEKTKGVLEKRPPETGPRTLIFNWAPMFGDLSLAGDMGYTTGPVVYTPQGPEAGPPSHGMYFSVWQKQANGVWKVAIDMGIGTPEPVASIDTKFKAARSLVLKPSKPTEDYRTLDVELIESMAKLGPLDAYRAMLADEFRIHRNGRMPTTTRAGLAELGGWPATLEFIDGKVAASGDMAFTYGRYSMPEVGETTEKGYYVHVWRRNARGAWKLAADVKNPLRR